MLCLTRWDTNLCDRREISYLRSARIAGTGTLTSAQDIVFSKSHLDMSDSDCAVIPCVSAVIVPAVLMAPLINGMPVGNNGEVKSSIRQP